MFKDVSQMPDGLRAHWRYPEDIFDTQTEQFTQYHILDPVQFYSKQNLWDIAPKPESLETTGTTAAPSAGNNGGRSNTLAATNNPIDALYLTLGLPGETEQEFTLEREFVPRNAANLSAFMFARMDGDNYGKLVVYNVSDQSAPSPAQAATSISSDQFISGQFTLLDQGGSSVFSGSVQLVPVGNAIVYVRPVWVVGQGSQTFPRFRFVTAATGDRAVLGCDVNDAITALVTGKPTQAQRVATNGGTLTNGCNGVTTPITTPPNTTPGGSSTTTTTSPTTTPTVPTNATAQQLFLQAQQEFSAAQAALKAGDLGAYQQHNAAGYILLNQAIAKGGAGVTTTTKP
jgi:uncharacterized membrane protein (UPF0182 family)